MNNKSGNLAQESYHNELLYAGVRTHCTKDILCIPGTLSIDDCVALSGWRNIE